MKILLQRYTSYLMLVLLYCSFYSCSKLVDAGIPEDRIVNQAVFENDATATSAAAGMYVQMLRTNQQFAGGGITLFAGLSADELYNTTSSVNTDEFTNNALSAGNNVVRNNLWVAGYQLLFQANNIIEGLEQSTGVTQVVKHQLLGEAKFVRAFCHFYLVNLFGDIPLVMETDYRNTSKLPRIASSKIYEQVITDLEAAKALLGAPYVTTNRARPNKLAAAALLSRALLYTSQWERAEAEASEIVHSGMYSLVTNLNNAFLPPSTETIWQVVPSSTTLNTWDGNNFIPGTGAVPAYPLTQVLNNAFNTGDLRKINWTKSTTVGTNSFTYPFKYKIKTSTTLQECYVVLRLAEQYLVRAEARAHQNKTDSAIADINKVRTRAGLSNISFTTMPALFTAIEKERQLELFAEWGHRWFDLNRTNRINNVLSLKPGWQTTDALYPVPYAEIQRNPALTQNPGY